MGIRGLSTYIAERSDLYLLPYKLQDSYLVVDGNSVASQLYKKCTKCDSAFGGDYDEYYQIVSDFFYSLKKCNITPLIIFDGGYEKKKLQTVYSRNLNKLVVLKNSIQKQFSKFKFFPIFMKQTFWDVIEDLGLLYAQCDFEADDEIAAIGRHLNCPVLSFDSDYFIYDVLYIPFSTLKLEPVKNGDQKFYMDCQIYEVSIFLKEFEGLDRSLMPIIAVLLGNDYIENKTCSQFLKHVIMPRKKSMTYGQRKIHGVLHWLKKEPTVDSALAGILSHVNKKYREIVQKGFKKSIHNYTTSSRTLSSFFKSSVINDVSEMKDMNYYEKEDIRLKGLPKYFKDLFHQCKILPFLMDMATLEIYFTPLQVEDMTEPSAHTHSYPMIQAMYTIMSAFTNGDKPLKLYLKANNRFSITHLEKEPNLFPDLNIPDLHEKSPEIKMNLIFNILNLTDKDREIIGCFDNEWKIFIIAIIYWIKVLGNELFTSQIQAILFCSVANFTQKRVGYFTTVKSFAHKKGPLLSKLEKEENNYVPDTNESNFSKLISTVTELDCLKLAQKLLPFRRTSEDTISNFAVSKIHAYSVFQSLMYHLIQLNAVLNFPTEGLKMADFYSGTLIYNIFWNCKKKQNTIQQLLKDVPSIEIVYNFLVNKLFSYFPTDPKKIKRKGKGKKKKKKSVTKEPSEESEDVDKENLEYEDENNPYYFLRDNVK